MHEMGEWGSMPQRGGVSSPTKDRLVYLEHIRGAHDDEGFRLALTNQMRAPEVEIERLVWEVEMLANYGVA